MGGFGWAARQVSTLFNSRPELGVSVSFLSGRSRRRGSPAAVHGTPIVFCGAGCDRQTLARGKPDLLLTLDFRPRYRAVFDIFDRVPVIVWVRDPKPPHIQAEVDSLRLPKDPSWPQGIKPINSRALAGAAAARVRAGIPVLFGTPAPSLASVVRQTYGVGEVECVFLPNIVDRVDGPTIKSEKPQVIFLGRLDPIKRPWLFVELARFFPAVEFLMLGQPHFKGRGSWAAHDLPPNVRLFGHVDGALKHQIVSSAWVLVNTSIHESLPTSVLEALARETPILSFTNQDNVTSRFGIVAPWCSGDGRKGLGALVAGLRQLLDDTTRRTMLGREGRRWVEGTHHAAGFLQAFDQLCASAGVQRMSALPAGRTLAAAAHGRGAHQCL